MLEMALIILISSILVFFSEEWGNLFKKIFAIRGVKLFVPLIMASWLIVDYEPWLLKGLLGIKYVLHAIINALQSIMPSWSITPSLLTVLVLMLVSVLPVIGVDYLIRRKSPLGYRHKIQTCLILWISTAILLTVSFSY